MIGITCTTMIASKPRSRRPVRTQVSGRAHDSARTVRGNAGTSAAPWAVRTPGERFWGNGCDHETTVTSCPACARWWAKAEVCPATTPLSGWLGPTMASLRAEPPTPAEPVTPPTSSTTATGPSAPVITGDRGCLADSSITRPSVPSGPVDLVAIDGSSSRASHPMDFAQRPSRAGTPSPVGSPPCEPHLRSLPSSSGPTLRARGSRSMRTPRGQLMASASSFRARW